MSYDPNSADNSLSEYRDRIKELERLVKRIYLESGDDHDTKNHHPDCEALGCRTTKGRGYVSWTCCPCTCWRGALRDVIVGLNE